MNSTPLLSGEKLVENGAKKGNVNLPSKGLKQVIAQNTVLENEEVENTLETKKSLIEDQRIEKRSTLSFAEWKEDLQKALVIEKKGPHWVHIGHTCDNKTYIFPEEALHLMEIGALLLKYEKVSVSIQQAYSLLLGKSMKLYEYRVYSLLSREGYRLIRHRKIKSNIQHDSNKSTEILKADKSLNLMNSNDQCSVNNQSTSNGIIASDINDQTMCVLTPNDELIQKNDDKIESCSRKRKICDINGTSESSNVKRKAKEIYENDSVESYLPPFDKSKILNSIVDCYRKKKVYLTAPCKDFIPNNISLNEKKYIIDIENSFSNHRKVSSEIFESENNSRSIQTQNKNHNSKKQTFDNPAFDNKFVTNTPFFNHIYQQISTNQLECDSNFSNATAFSNASLLLNHNSSKFHLSHSCVENNKQDFVGQTDISSNSINGNISSNKLTNKTENNYDKYSQLLQEIKSFLSNTSDLQNESNRKILSNLIEKYNSYFGSNFTLNQKIINADVSNGVLENESLDMNVDILEQEHSNIKSGLNAICKPDDSNIPNNETSTIDENKNMQNWFDKDIWNVKPKEKNVFISNNLFQNLTETNSFLNGIKNFSRDKESGIGCWKQAKLFYLKYFAKETSIFTLNHSSNINNELLGSSIEPLLRPQDCKTVLSVLKRLQTTGINFNSNNICDEEIDILFDVYLPNQKNFRKTSPSTPNYCLIVWNSSSSLPSPMKLNLLRSKVPKGIKILFAIVSLDSIFFLEMENINLPTLNESCNK